MDKNEIMTQLRHHFILGDAGDITIDDEGVVSLEGDVQTITRIKKFPVKFGHIGGSFVCRGTPLITLENGPRTVGQTFDCERTAIRNLQCAPERVGGSFHCGDNQNLTSLIGAPKEVGQDFLCQMTEIKSLDGAPEVIPGEFDCNDTRLESFGSVESIGKRLYANNTKIRSLVGLPNCARGLSVNYDDHLGLLLLPELTFTVYLRAPPRDLMPILKKYHGAGRRSILAFASELIAAGYDGNAKL